MAASALAPFATGQSCLGSLGAGDIEHLLGQVQANGALGQGCEQGEHAARARAQIDHSMEGAGSGGLQQRPLHLGLVHIERTDLVPSGGVAGEIGRGVLGPGRLNVGQAIRVPNQHGIVRIDHAQQRLGRALMTRLAGKPVKHPGAVGKALNQSRLAQQLQMAGDARLALIQNMRQFHHG